MSASFVGSAGGQRPRLARCQALLALATLAVADAVRDSSACQSVSITSRLLHASRILQTPSLTSLLARELLLAKQAIVQAIRRSKNRLGAERRPGPTHTRVAGRCARRSRRLGAVFFLTRRVGARAVKTLARSSIRKTGAADARNESAPARKLARRFRAGCRQRLCCVVH